MENSTHVEKTGTGVIIARFQVHELHEAHLDLIRRVKEAHHKVIIILGVGHALGSQRNPLSFTARRLMIQEIYNNQIDIIPMKNQREDEVWSAEVDKRIREISPMGDVTLYGSRDSFIPHYKGQFKTVELESKTYVSGTEIRKNVSEETLSDPKFRAGIIHGLYNRYPTVYSTVDVAIMRNDEILLCMKPGEKHLRFVGGFVDVKDSSEIVTCRREVREETHCIVDDLEFICSMQIDDWRYRSEVDKIMTHFYIGYFQSGTVQPDDDIVALQWVKISELGNITVMPEHRPLMSELIKYLAKKNSKHVYGIMVGGQEGIKLVTNENE